MISIVYWCEFAVAGIVKVVLSDEASMPARWVMKSVDVLLAMRADCICGEALGKTLQLQLTC